MDAMPSDKSRSRKPHPGMVRGIAPWHEIPQPMNSIFLGCGLNWRRMASSISWSFTGFET